MIDTLPFKCPRCSTAWERASDDLNEPQVTVYRGDEPRKYTYRDTCPNCGTSVVVEAIVTGGGDA